ncbi:hypothetical protein BH23ACT9_BH23ACT9_32020 [soil metagenome]
MADADAGLLADVIEERTAEDRRTALRALLRTPLMTAAHPAFPLVRRHREHLRDWLGEQAGWHLTVDAEHARLHKLPADLRDHTRPGITPGTGRPLSRRRYVLLCLALGALERADNQTTLGWLADRIIDLAADPALVAAGIEFTLQSRPERADLVAAVRLLVATGVLARTAGDEEAYLAATGDALYDVDRRVLASLLPGLRGPSTVTAADLDSRIAADLDSRMAADLDSRMAADLDSRMAALVSEVEVDQAEARTRRARQHLTRRLLDDPVVYTADVSAAEQTYLALPGQRHATARRVAAATGLVPELRAEGTAMLDPTGEASDLRMPQEGTQGHATLLLAEHLAAAGVDGVPVSDLEAAVAGWAHIHPWSKAARQEGAEVAITAIAAAHLEALGLVTVAGGRVTPRPAIARYAVDEVTLLGDPPDGEAAG